MSYRQLFSSLDCQCIVIVEDDFRQGEYKKERALYDMTRMALSDRESYMKEIKCISTELADTLSSFFALFDQCIDELGRWEDVIPRWDIRCAFTLVEELDTELKKRIEDQYNLINDDLMLAVYETGAKYGIGVNHPSYFDELYDDYILFENRAKSVRVYTDFSATTQSLFISDIDSATDEKSVVCIVDNYLAGTNRAQEIINLIKEKKFLVIIPKTYYYKTKNMFCK